MQGGVGTRNPYIMPLVVGVLVLSFLKVPGYLVGPIGSVENREVYGTFRVGLLRPSIKMFNIKKDNDSYRYPVVESLFFRGWVLVFLPNF